MGVKITHAKFQLDWFLVISLCSFFQMILKMIDYHYTKFHLGGRRGSGAPGGSNFTQIGKNYVFLKYFVNFHFT